MNEARQKDNILQFPAPEVVEVDQGGHVIVDVEKGYTRIADELLEALCKIDMAGRYFRIVNTVIRKTYGYNKKSDWIALEQFSEMTGISKKHVSPLITHLVTAKILLRSESGQVKEVSINKAISEWRKPVRETAKSPKKGSAGKTPKMEIINPQKGDSLPQSGDLFPQTGDYNRHRDKELKDKILLEQKKAAQKKAAKKKTAQKKAVEAPRGLGITDAMTTWAKNNGVFVDLVTETEQFLDHHRAKGSKYKDWVSAWRTWMRNSIRFNKRPAPAKASIQVHNPSKSAEEGFEHV